MAPAAGRSIKHNILMNSVSPISSRRGLLAVASLAALAFVFTPPLSAAPEKANTEKKVVGSIRLAVAPKREDLPAHAKITFEQALTTALAAVPGGVVKAELEVEDGYLQYSFEIVNASKTVMEVEVDAGTGAVLAIDSD